MGNASFSNTQITVISVTTFCSQMTKLAKIDYLALLFGIFI